MDSTMRIEDTNVNIIISEDVVCGIAVNAAKEVKGVASISTKLTAADIKDIFGRKAVGKGVKVEIVDNDAIINIFLNVKYGSKIPEVAENVQVAVQNAIQSMTGLNVVKVNVHVIGITINKEIKTNN
jgi:uncharacterized alkaline shock family protein YloU